MQNKKAATKDRLLMDENPFFLGKEILMKNTRRYGTFRQNRKILELVLLILFLLLTSCS